MNTYLRWIAIGMMLGILVTACNVAGGGEPSPDTAPTRAPQRLGTITWTGSKCSLDRSGPALQSGNVSLELVNTTADNTVFALLKIGEGHTFDELDDHISQERQLAEEGESPLGLPEYAEEVSELLSLADVSITRIVTLDPGRYAIVCSRDYQRVGRRPFGLLGPIKVGE